MRNSTTESRRAACSGPVHRAGGDCGCTCVDRASGTLTTSWSPISPTPRSCWANWRGCFRFLRWLGATVLVLALAGLLNHHRGDRDTHADHGRTRVVLGCAFVLAFSVRATKVHEVLMAGVWDRGRLDRRAHSSGCCWRIFPPCPGLLPGTPHQSLRSAQRPTTGPIAWDSGLCSGVVAQRGLLSAGLTRGRASAQGRSKFKGTGVRDEGVLRFPGSRRVQAQGRVSSLDDDPVLFWARVAARAAVMAGQDSSGILSRAGPGRHGMERLFRHHLHPLRCGHHRAGKRLSGHVRLVGRERRSVRRPCWPRSRARASLDVLMTTPLSTDRIVLAKRWGARPGSCRRWCSCRHFLGRLIVAFAEPEVPSGCSAQSPDPVDGLIALPSSARRRPRCSLRGRGDELRPGSGHVMRRVGRAIAVASPATRSSPLSGFSRSS